MRIPQETQHFKNTYKEKLALKSCCYSDQGKQSVISKEHLLAGHNLDLHLLCVAKKVPLDGVSGYITLEKKKGGGKLKY